MDTSREDIPRVSINTVADLRRMKANYQRSLLTQLDEHLRPRGGEGERDALLAHLSQYVDLTFAMAQPNLRVNGQQLASLDIHEQNTEAFDEALDRRIWSLADTRLQWQKRLAETRRTLPPQLEATVSSLLSQGRAVDAAETEVAEVIPEPPDTPEDEVMRRHSMIEETLRHITALSGELDQVIPSQQERSERVRTVTAEVKALKP